MTKLSKILGLHGPLPFVDIDVSTDNRYFVDPCRIRLSKNLDPWRERALNAIDSFLDKVVESLLAHPDTMASKINRELLSQFKEPNETRLGMSTQGVRGHGGAQDAGERIAASLETDLQALLTLGIIHHLEQLPLFVGGVDKDITSDITTRLIFSALVDFTATMCEEFPALRTAGTGMRSFRIQTWSPESLEWTTIDAFLPSINKMALVLVPDQWVGPNLLMNHARYYDTSVLSYFQFLNTSKDSRGRINRPKKKYLRNRPECPRGRATNIRRTLQAHSDGKNLVAEFENFVQLQHEKKRKRRTVSPE